MSKLRPAIYTPELIAKLKEAGMSKTIEKERAPLSTSRKMQIEIEAAKILREQIETVCGNDPDFFRDAIEGETNVRELIAKLVAEEGEDKSLIDGLDAFTDGLSARKDRIKSRIETRRAMIASALEIAELESLETPTGTVSVSKVAPKVIVQDESEIPTKFWKSGKPTLDKAAVKDALKSGEIIPGATLSNGAKTIIIRRN